MMGQTFQDLLDLVSEVAQQKYRTDPDYDRAVLAILLPTVQTMLEKLRDLHDPC
jgi:hypothetical protein